MSEPWLAQVREEQIIVVLKRVDSIVLRQLMSDCWQVSLNWILFFLLWELVKFSGLSSSSERRSWTSRRPGRGRGRSRCALSGCLARGSLCAAPPPWRTSGPSSAPWAGPGRGRGARSSSPGSRWCRTRPPSRQRDSQPQVTRLVVVDESNLSWYWDMWNVVNVHTPYPILYLEISWKNQKLVISLMCCRFNADVEFMLIVIFKIFDLKLERWKIELLR